MLECMEHEKKGFLCYTVSSLLINCYYHHPLSLILGTIFFRYRRFAHKIRCKY